MVGSGTQEAPVRKLAEVEEAKAVMIEGVEWSVMKWLSQKKRVRKIADRANAALDAAEAEVKRGWSEELRRAYATKDGSVDPQLAATASRIRHMDAEALRAHDDAEATFDEAERQMSARLAREGCKKAIFSWELHEKAIAKAEAVLQKVGKP